MTAAIDPGQIPQYTGDFDTLTKAVTELRKRAIGIRGAGQDVHSRFQATAAYYQAPEADQLLSSTQPVMDTADEFAGHIESLADALDTFVSEAKPHADRLQHLKGQAIAFVADVEGDDDWTNDQHKVDTHNALMDGVAEAVVGFRKAEHDAAVTIGAISPAVCRPVGDEGGTYGMSAKTLESMPDLPWGAPVSRTYERWSLGWWGHGTKSWAWDGIVKDSLWGGFVGLGTFEDNMLGVNGSDARQQTWDGLRRTVVGAYTYGMDAAGLGDHLSDWQHGSEAYAKDFGKQFIDYDEWQEDPARAHAVTSFNLLTLVGGAGGALAKLGRTGRFAEAAGTVAEVGNALDPVSGAARAARALSDLPKVSEVLTHVSEHLRLPRTRFPDGALDLSDRYRVDKDGHLIPINSDGTPNLARAPHEPAAAVRTGGSPDGDRELVGAGASDSEAGGRAGSHASPHASHDAGGAHGANAGSVPEGRGHSGEPGGGHSAEHHGTDRHGLSDGHPGDPGGGDTQGHRGPVVSDEGHGHGGDADGPADIDPAKYTKNAEDFAQAHTGRMESGQEAGVLDELSRAKMPEADQQKVLRALGKDPYGAGVAEMISRGHLRDVEGYRKLLDMCKQGPTKADPKGMVPAVHMAMKVVTELQERGVGRVGVELDTQTFDLDAYTRHADGSVDYGYQLKDVTNIQGIKSAAVKAAKQLNYPGVDHRVAILDIHQPMRDLTPRMFREAEFQAQRMGGSFLLRFPDGSMTIPPNSPTFP
ncbi:hypothetical protein AB0E70_21420 [Streptomyces murinus]|uniref:hypothetical protein n=1 Tax=Streptomyces murinus TaxID=33900 RepID=UPI000A39605B|nr:hypothetical protein [Streptomyces murinus]